MPGSAEQVDVRSDGDGHAEAQHAPAADDMEEDMEVDVVGLPGSLPATAAGGVAKCGAPSSARSAPSPSQAVTAEIPEAALHMGAPETEAEGAAALPAREGAGMLREQPCPDSAHSPVNPAVYEPRTEKAADGRDSAEGVSLHADQAVSQSRGDAAATELCASAVLTVPEQPPSLPVWHASAAASQAAARPGMVRGTLLPPAVQQGRVGSAQGPSLPAVQSTLVCTEVQAVPSTLVEIALPPPQAATANPARAAPAFAVHASESGPKPQHCQPAGLMKSQPPSQQVLQPSIYNWEGFLRTSFIWFSSKIPNTTRLSLGLYCSR